MRLQLHGELPSERARDEAAWGECSGDLGDLGGMEKLQKALVMHQMASICQQQRDYKLHPTTASLHICISAGTQNGKSLQGQSITTTIAGHFHIFVQASSGCKPPPATTAEPPPKKVLTHFFVIFQYWNFQRQCPLFSFFIFRNSYFQRRLRLFSFFVFKKFIFSEAVSTWLQLCLPLSCWRNMSSQDDKVVHNSNQKSN